MRDRKRHLLALLFWFPFLFGTSRAVPEQPPGVRFAVTIAPELAAGKGVSGRLMVVLGQEGGGEPRLTIGQTGMNADPILAGDVADLAAGREAVLDDRSALFPIAHLNNLPPGDYAAQAMLHINLDLNMPNAPGDFYGPVRTIHIDPARGEAFSLELSRAIPPEALPAETELVKYVRISSRLLSAFHHRPIFLRAGVILPRDFSREQDKLYPLRVHIGGYGERFTEVGRQMAAGSSVPPALDGRRHAAR